MINSHNIEKTFIDYLEQAPCKIAKDETPFYQIININKNIWDLENKSRKMGKKYKKLALNKAEIDKQNQLRADTIHEIDIYIGRNIGNKNLHDPSKYYAESPGMIIDRLSIMFIRDFEIRSIIAMAREKKLVAKYINKRTIIADQIEHLGGFLNIYLRRLKTGRAYYRIFNAVKIYNDPCVRKYI